MQSVNDQPTNVETYGTVNISSAERPLEMYYYEKDGKYYLEQPYSGIYEMNDDLEKTIKAVF